MLASQPYPVFQLKGETAERRLGALDLENRIRPLLGKRTMDPQGTEHARPELRFP
jgi:hypothetical protein